MKSITIKVFDDDIIEAIQQRATSSGESPGKIIQNILRKSLNVHKQELPKRDVSSLFNVWTEDEAKEFEEAVQVFEQIDEDMWE